jgi:predicted GIY-YIG superfamily endonuclease
LFKGSLSVKKMSTVYVLELEDNKYYVGRTSNLQRRLQDHFSNFGGSYWTRTYKPIRLIRKIENCDSIFDEDKFVKETMAEYGIDNVRGGSYVQDSIPCDVRANLEKEIRFAKDLCISCGSENHFVHECDVVIVYECANCKKHFDNEIDCNYHVIRCVSTRHIGIQTNFVEKVTINENDACCCCVVM